MIEEHTFTSLKDFASFVAERASEKKPYWFRGVQDGDGHKLQPSLYRHSTVERTMEFHPLEQELMETFRHRAPPFQTSIPQDPIELLFFMQHHGVPTRLLDWSENPFVGLFFALEKALWETTAQAKSAAVWMLSPTMLNATAFQNHGSGEKILSAGDDLLNAYTPDKHRKPSGKMPLAMWGVHNSRRIVAQRGVFVLFGSNTSPMESDAMLRDSGMMQKLILPQTSKRDMAEALFSMGVTDSVIYPDLDGLGREIKNRSGFWRAA